MVTPRRVVTRNLRGVALGFDVNRHFGFLRHNEETYYVHRKGIRVSHEDDQGRKYLKKDQIVTFDLCEGYKGLIATNVRVQQEFRCLSQGAYPSYKAPVLLKNVHGEIFSVMEDEKSCIIRTHLSDFRNLKGHFDDFNPPRTHSPPEVRFRVICDIAKKEGINELVALHIRITAPKEKTSCNN